MTPHTSHSIYLRVPTSDGIADDVVHWYSFVVPQVSERISVPCGTEGKTRRCIVHSVTRLLREGPDGKKFDLCFYVQGDRWRYEDEEYPVQ